MGEHYCLYYDSLEDLCLVVASFFREGRQRNELCLWIIPENLDVEAAKSALREGLKDLDTYIAAGQLEILEPREWYTPGGVFDPERVLAAWGQKERQALAQGFVGVRAVGDASWCSQEDRDKLRVYEDSVTDVIPQSKIFALCTYSTEKFKEEEVREARAHHEVTLSNFQGKLAIFR